MISHRILPWQGLSSHSAITSLGCQKEAQGDREQIQLRALVKQARLISSIFCSPFKGNSQLLNVLHHCLCCQEQKAQGTHQTHLHSSSASPTWPESLSWSRAWNGRCPIDSSFLFPLHKLLIRIWFKVLSQPFYWETFTLIFLAKLGRD